MDGSNGASLAAFEPLIEAHKKDIDRTLICESLKRTPDDRLRRLEAFVRDIAELRKAVASRQ